MKVLAAAISDSPYANSSETLFGELDEDTILDAFCLSLSLK